MNRRALTLGIALSTALATGALTASPAQAGRYPTETGCYDIIGSDGADYTAATGVVHVSMVLAAPSCKRAVYGLRVYDGSGTLTTVTMNGDGVTTHLSFTAQVTPGAPAGSVVGIEGTTSLRGYVVDYAPDPQTLDATTDANNNGIQDNAEVYDGVSPATSSFR